MRRWPWLLVAAGAVPVAVVMANGGHGLPVDDPLRDLAWIAALGAAEELAFRGGLQDWLLRRAPESAVAARRWGLSAANGIASLAFAAAHAPAQGVWHALAVLPVSLLLGMAYEAGGRRLALPVALHLWFNVALYAASARLLPGGA